MNESKTMTKDPVCGMTVDESSAIRAERDGKTYFFCGEGCRKKFLLSPADSNVTEKESGGCCS